MRNPPKDAHLIQLQLCSSPEHVDEDLVIRLQNRPSLLWCPSATCTYVNIYIVFVFDKAWLAKKSGNKTPFRFRLSRPTLLSTWETPAHRCWTSIPTSTCCRSPRAAPEWNRVQSLSRDWFWIPQCVLWWAILYPIAIAWSLTLVQRTYIPCT